MGYGYSGDYSKGSSPLDAEYAKGGAAADRSLDRNRDFVKEPTMFTTVVAFGSKSEPGSPQEYSKRQPCYEATEKSDCNVDGGVPAPQGKKKAGI